MKKRIVASVLLASMMFAVPGYADYELTPDENDSYDILPNPLPLRKSRRTICQFFPRPLDSAA